MWCGCRCILLDEANREPLEWEWKGQKIEQIPICMQLPSGACR